MASILVVDDEEDIRLLVGLNLAAWGHDHREAGGLEETLARCREQVPDILLLDLSLGDGEGSAVLAQLRAEGLAPRHAVLLSASPPDVLRRIAAEHGVEFLAKPFALPALRDLVGRLAADHLSRSASEADHPSM